MFLVRFVDIRVDDDKKISFYLLFFITRNNVISMS